AIYRRYAGDRRCDSAARPTQSPTRPHPHWRGQDPRPAISPLRRGNTWLRALSREERQRRGAGARITTATDNAPRNAGPAGQVTAVVARLPAPRSHQHATLPTTPSAAQYPRPRHPTKERGADYVAPAEAVTTSMIASHCNGRRFSCRMRTLASAATAG